MKRDPFGTLIILAVVLILLLVGYNLGLSVGEERAITIDSTPTLDTSAMSPVRFVVTHRDTVEGGAVVEVIEDYIWHTVTITVKYFGNELATAQIDK